MADFVGSIACPWWPYGMPRCPPSPGPRAGQTARPGIRKGQDHDRGRRELRRQPDRRTPSCGTPRRGSPGPCSGWRCRAGGSRSRRSLPSSCGRPGRACRPVPSQGQPGHGRGPAPAAELDRRGWPRPLRRRGRGRGAGPKPSMGNGHAGRGHQARRRIVADTVTLAYRPMRCPGVGGLPYRSGPVAFRSRGIRDTECRLGRGGAASGGARVCIARAWPLGPPWAWAIPAPPTRTLGSHQSPVQVEGQSLGCARPNGPPEVVSVTAHPPSPLDGTHGEILTLWSFRPPMGQRRSPAMRLTDPPMMTTPNRYDSKACDSTARRIRGSRTVVSDTW
jgi:hypothetical protein